MKIIFKNRFVSPLSQEQTCGHESFFPACNHSLNVELVDVIENPPLAIKSKKKSYKIRGN
jgi:hypothetical protein